MLRFVCGFVSIVVVIQGPHRPITWLTFQTDTACSDTRQEMPTATESHSIKQRIPANCVVYNCNSYVLYMYVSVCVCFIVSYIYMVIQIHVYILYIYIYTPVYYVLYYITSYIYICICIYIIGDIRCTFEVRKCLHFQHPTGPGNLSPARRGARPRSRGGAAPSPSFKNRRPVQAG